MVSSCKSKGVNETILESLLRLKLKNDLVLKMESASEEKKQDDKLPQFLIYKETNVTIHCFDNLLDEIYEFIFDAENEKHWISRDEIRLGLVLEEIDNHKLEKAEQLLLFLNKYNLTALTLELHECGDILSSSCSEFIQLFQTISDFIIDKSLKRIKFCFNGLKPIHYQLLTNNCIKYLQSTKLEKKNKKIALRLNINKSLFNYWQNNNNQFLIFLNQIKQTQNASNIFLTFKHLSLSIMYFQQTISLLNSIELNTSISSILLKFYDNEIFEEMRLESGINTFDTESQQNLFNKLVSCLKNKRINGKLYDLSDNKSNIQMWKEFDRNIDCTSLGQTDISLRLSFENCPITFPSKYVYKFLNGIRLNKNVVCNVLILLCREWNDKSLWNSLQNLVCSEDHYLERLEIWGAFISEENIIKEKMENNAKNDTDNKDNDHDDDEEEDDEFISDFFDGISWKECTLQSIKIDRIRLASNDFFVDKIVDLIKYGGVMMNFISIAFEMLSKDHSHQLIDAFIYRLKNMFESQNAVRKCLNNLSYCDLTDDVIQTIHDMCKHNHIRLEIFVDFFSIQDDDDEYNESEEEIDYDDDEIKEKLKTEAEASKLGRMEREIYFKKSLSRLFHTTIHQYNQDKFDSVFETMSKKICFGPILID